MADHPMQAYAAQVVSNIEATLQQIAPRDFLAISALLADTARKVVVMGGRLTHAHGDYFATLLRVMRADVAFIADMLTDWQQALLDLAAGDVVVIFDIRRYEGNAVHFAELAAGQGPKWFWSPTAGCRPPLPMRAMCWRRMSRCPRPGIRPAP